MKYLVSTTLSLFVGAAAMAATPYSMDATHSSLNFIASQTGSPVEGKFTEYRADIVFADEDLAASRFDVTVALKSLDAGEDDRNDTLRGTDFFDVAKFPTGRFVTTAFTRTSPGHYEATGKLTLRDVTREIRLPFTFERSADGKEAWLKGSVKLNRLDYGVGQGEWKSTEWVANEVTVKFSLRLAPGADGRKTVPRTPPPATTK